MESNNQFTNENPYGFYIKQPKSQKNDAQKKTVTYEEITERLKIQSEGNRGLSVIILAFWALIVVLAGGAAVLFSAAGFIIFLILGVPGIILLSKSIKTKKSLKENSFFIVTDTCCKKKIIYDGDSTSDSYCLYFENAGNHSLIISHAEMSAPSGSTDEWLYDNTEIGDKYYLIYLSGSKKPTLCIAQKFGQIDMSKFTEENGRIVPRK